MSIRALLQTVFGSPMRNRFTLFFIVLALVPTLSLGAIALYFIDLSHRQDVAALETQLVDQKIAEIQKYFADTLGDVQVPYEQKSEIAPELEDAVLEGIIGGNPAFREVRLVKLDGAEAAARSGSKAGAQLSVDHPEGTGGVGDFSLLPEFVVPKSGGAYVSPVRQTLDGPVVTRAVPVRNKNSDIIEILIADISLSGLFSSIEKVRLGSDGYLLIFDSSGALLVSPPGLRPGTDFARAERVAQVLRGSALTGLDEKDRYVSYVDGEPVIGVGKKVPGLGWAVLAEWPIASADALIHDVRAQVLQLTLLTIIAVLALAPLFAARLIRPIRELEAAAKRVEQGDLDTVIEIATGDELEELGERFATMTKGLKRLAELRNEFVHIVTHELRTPVTAIRGFTELIKGGNAGPVTPQLAELIEPVWVSANHLNALINDLLDVATSEAGKLKIALQPLELAPMIKEVFEELRFVAEGRHVTLAYGETAIPAVRGDKMRVKQVLMNFVSNAIKYNREGGTVTIRHDITPAGVVTHVTDTGAGMSPEDLAHLFEKFYRTRSAAQSATKGTGLGLFITKDLVEKMGGTVSVSSEVDAGTTFSFVLPLSTPKAV